MSTNQEGFWSFFLQRMQRKLIIRGILLAVVAIPILIIAAWTLLTGKPAGEELDTVYGKRRGHRAVTSVNGTSVLSDMFSRAGHKVTTRSRLSPGLDAKADVIVWIPNDFAPPTRQQQEFLDRWLQSGSGRTLIYVGRDFNAASAYFADVAPLTSGEDAKKFAKYLADAKAAHDSERSKMPKSQYGHWFTAKQSGKKQKVTQLGGDWAQGIDASKVNIEIEGRLEPPVEADRTPATDLPLPSQIELLLYSDTAGDGFTTGDAAIVTRVEPSYSDGQVIVIANGSFVLNYPLVNHEHRKLAGKLIAECGPAKRVVFLESESGGPEVLDKEPQSSDSGLLGILQVWPLNAIVIHLTILGIVLCLARSPIFGRAKELPGESPADFGKHVTALGRLMARTKDRIYAEQRILQYQTQGKRGSGKSHLKGK